MNSETLGLLFTTIKIGIFSTRFKAFETEFTAKSSLRISLTINMAITQRISQVGKDSYLLDLSEIHQIGVHAKPSPCRSTLLLAPSRTDGSNDRKSREKELSLSLSKTPKTQLFAHLVLPLPFCLQNEEDEHYCYFVSFSLTIHLILNVSLLLIFDT